MILIRLLGLHFFFLTTTLGVNCQTAEFSKIKRKNVPDFNPEFSTYCNWDTTTDFESYAVLSSFFGSHKNSISAATKHARKETTEVKIEVKPSDLHAFRQKFETVLNDPGSDEQSKLEAQLFLNSLKPYKDFKDLFKDKVQVNARDYIVQKSKDYHFTLINEAHYCSQNRAFSRTLLEPLWRIGYRYLALEALSHNDSTVEIRGYPNSSTGYYTQDPVFGNFVREALRIGYRLVTYETTANFYDATLRDRDQAWNIYNNTLAKDSVGKVLIHAGYGHIGELGGAGYNPMGAQLKVISNQDILTIDQERMKELTDRDKLSSYYRYVIDNYGFEEPIIFLGNNNKPLLDPLYSFGSIDLQVYLPLTRYIKGRPSWIYTGSSKPIELPQQFLKYQGCLIQVLGKNEKESPVPIDQIVIQDGTALVLEPGQYSINIINCQGTLIGTAGLKVN